MNNNYQLEVHMFPHHSTILFQGDSITDGNRSRDNDLNHVMGHGYAYLIASRLGADHPDRSLNFVNRGISGNRIVDLYVRWQEDAVNIKPDIVSILVGVNDVLLEFMNGTGVSAAKYRRVYELLIEELRQANPEVVTVLCEPFILPVGQVADNWPQWNKEISLRQEAAKLIARRTGSIYVPLQQEFYSAAENAPCSYWLWDGFHPTPAGHEIIARKWIECVSENLVRR
ncbi:SGNH/GDSL hydrolase family protein [Paenibacillus sp. sptzw28]|uniref:SGNH/GDSL hydrolase family protein n=1 Tax=Paenibacillus sp. sptzw28 TaxID=715179 RepID=UPI002161C42B|nr:SGNH/GDSL hydrolase family protein [Paenibacillus sp. sptzw28]